MNSVFIIHECDHSEIPNFKNFDNARIKRRNQTLPRKMKFVIILIECKKGEQL